MKSLTRTLIAGIVVSVAALALPSETIAGYLAEYSFDDVTVSGSTVNDVSGQGNNGTILSGVSVSQPGRFGQAFSFSGTNSEVSAPAPSAFGSSFSISLWLNTNNLLQSQRYLLLHGTSAGNQSGILFGYVPSTVEFFAGAYTGANPRTGSQITLSQANTWYNVVYTYDGSDFRGYLNGSQVFHIAESFSVTATGPLYIGSASQLFPSGNYVGLLDDIGIFNFALSPGQVAYLQTNSVATVAEPTTLPLIAFAMLGLVAVRRAGRGRS